jgi:rhodanese-related sulfurtransferase/rubrerythrin
MGLLDYFKPVKAWNADQVKRYLESHGPQDYNLVDVRQPKEYQRGHLPGAQLIPVKDLEERLEELDPRKPTITYCAAGVRSRAAASILSHADFDEVVSMSGGINAWEGLVAEGEPEMGTAWFSSARSPEEHLGLAWLLEEGTRQFYAELAATFGDGEEGSFFRQLVAAEEKHKSSLGTLYHGISGGPPESDFPFSVLPEPPGPTILEGGLPLDRALQWVKGRDYGQVLQLAIGLEANAYDRYLLMRREAAEEQSRAIFNRLAEEEKIHLRLLSDHLDDWLENQ